MPRRPRRSRRWWGALAGGVLAAAALALAGAGQPHVGPPLANGLARTPPMGWDTWNTFGCSIDQTLVERTADALVSTGMRDAGYRYVVVDDCWFNPQRDAAGALQASPSRFPAGMRALGDYLHARGLLFGLYESPSASTCAQAAGVYPGATGSAGHEAQDARSFASWGVDYLKYDWCSSSGTAGDQAAGFARMAGALAATGRPVVLSVNPNSLHATTAPSRWWGDVANLWRTTQDITAAWSTGGVDGVEGVRDIIDIELALGTPSGPGGWDDADMLEVGRAGLTPTEQRTHLALWAMLSSPLIAGDDITQQDASTTALLVNPALIAIDQDPLGVRARQVAGDSTARVLVKPLGDGALAVALLNETDTPRRLTAGAEALGPGARPRTVHDVWTGAVTTVAGTLTAEVPAHGTAVFLVDPLSP